VQLTLDDFERRAANREADAPAEPETATKDDEAAL
jgi:hypothetical protein